MQVNLYLTGRWPACIKRESNLLQFSR